MRRKERLTVEDIKSLIQNRNNRSKNRTMQVLYKLGKLNNEVEDECLKLIDLIERDEFKNTPGGVKLAKLVGKERINEKGLLLMESLLYNIEYELLDVTERLELLADKVALVKDIDTIIKDEHIKIYNENEVGL